jgi:glycogen debranching enzyme
VTREVTAAGTVRLKPDPVLHDHAMMSVAFARGELIYAWKGPSLLILGHRGHTDERQPLAGFYHFEARFLSALRLDINGKEPWLCEAASVQPDTLLFNYVHPEITTPGGGGTGQSGDDTRDDNDGVPERALDITTKYRVGIAHLDITVSITNRARRAVAFDAGWTLDGDFADIQEALVSHREQQAPVERTFQDGVLELTYTHEELPYRTTIRLGPEWNAEGTRVVRHLSLDPGRTVEWTWHVRPATGWNYLNSVEERLRERTWSQWTRSFTRIEIPGNTELEAAMVSNVRDFASFALLTGEDDEWLSLQAGMPLYPAFFGRDAVTSGWQAGMIDRATSLDASMTRLGRMQGDRDDDWRDEEPGRIPYQVRSGPLALLNINPYAAYYADFASPLMFVVSLANLYAWTGDRDAVARHWDAARRILDWARERGDADGDGYLEYCTRSKKGTKNQGWKDSGDSIIYDDGTPVDPPIATCELQGYWYIAQELMSALCAAMGATADARAHHESAEALKDRFNRDWWMPGDEFVALALDSNKRQVRAVTSNVGHCLATGIIAREHLAAVVGRLFAPDMFSGWGVRTLSSQHTAYDPLSYHRGSVWAVEQATIIFGLRRFGFDARAVELSRAMFDLARLYPEYRIPETVGGYARGERATPGAYPRSNTPQLWNATAFPLMLQTLLGIVPLAPAATLLIDPVLPEWMPDVILRDLRVGEARTAIRFWRDGGESKWEVLHTQGTLHVVRQPPPESVTASLFERTSGVLETIRRSAGL